MRDLGFEQSEASACVMRLVEMEAVSVVVEVHADGIVAMGLKNRRDKFCEDLNQFLSINNL